MLVCWYAGMHACILGEESGFILVQVMRRILMPYVVRSTKGTTFSEDNKSEKVFKKLEEAKSTLSNLNIYTSEEWRVIELSKK